MASQKVLHHVAMVPVLVVVFGHVLRVWTGSYFTMSVPVESPYFFLSSVLFDLSFSKAAQDVLLSLRNVLEKDQT